MAKPFFFRIDAAAIIDFATDPEGEGMSLLKFGKELQKGKSDIPFIQGIIDEAVEYIDKKKSAGSKGGFAKASNAIAPPGSALANPSIPLASSSNNNIEPIKTLLPQKTRKARPPSGDQQTFIAWWLYAYQKTMDCCYLVSDKDAKHVSAMLHNAPLNEVLSKAAVFFISEDPFFKDKKDISFFRSQINKVPKANGDHLPRLRDLQIIPPDGVKLADWKFWELS